MNVNPFHCSGLKSAHDTPANSIFDGPITNLLSILYIFIESLSRAHAKPPKGLNGFKFGTFIGHFSSDQAESTAVKVLRPKRPLVVLTPRVGLSEFPLLFRYLD